MNDGSGHSFASPARLRRRQLLLTRRVTSERAPRPFRRARVGSQCEGSGSHVRGVEMHSPADTTNETGQDLSAPPDVETPSRWEVWRAGKPPVWLAFLWRDRRAGIATAAAVAAGFGLLAAWATPRGPVTVAQALTAMIAGLVVGATCGFLLRSRWGMVLAPLVFVGLFELVRWGAEGPTVDAPDLSSLVGILVAAVGRGFQGIMTLVPMVLGAALGAAAARRVRGETTNPSGRLGRTGLIARRGVAVFVALGLVLLGVFI